MTRRFSHLAVALTMAAVLGLSNLINASPVSAREAGSVYLLRGGFNLFSFGLDVLSDKLRAQGISSTVAYYRGWPDLVTEIAERYRASRHAPVVLIGHSFGANAVLKMAASLNELGVPVELIVTFDPLEDIKVTRNVRQVINFFVGSTGSVAVLPSAAFRGTIENVDVNDLNRNLGHYNMEEDEGLQKRAIGATLRAFN